ncbi:hypothetical protein M0805_002104 [Coniferiporia weirii]|nr:hypothetical protein M0805_002104 [Coniferiporia weirii]
MESEHPTALWQAMQDGNVFYRRQQLYSVQDKLPSLDDYIVAGCRYGGPIAMVRDSTRMVTYGRNIPSFAKNEVRVYSSAGEGLLVFTWNQGKIIKLGWTLDEQLVVLNEEGIYRVYDLQGEYQQFSLGADTSETGVVDARIHEGGMVALTGSLSLLELKGFKGAKPLVLANPSLAEPPHSWTIIPPDLTISRHTEVLLSPSTSASVFSVDNLECIDQQLDRGPFLHLSSSPNGKSLALMTFSGTLWVVSTDFRRNLAEFDTTTKVSEGAEGPPRQVEWCGNDAVLVTWEKLALLVGPFGDTLSFLYPGPTFVIGEPDGVRIIGPDVCDFVQKVPTSSVNVFRPGSTAPAAILFDAWENFQKRAPKADENIRSIKPDLAKAVDECIDAAGREWEPYWQKKLLNAAKFGGSFLDLHNPTDFVHMGQTLKVLNAVRYYEIGIPLTYAQFIYTSAEHLITRLTSRSLHLLALRMSTYLILKPDNVLKHWACAKIARAKSSASAGDADAGDDELCRVITEKFKSVGGARVSYADIAKRSWEVGRPGLATKLLDFETQAADQVPLLLEMNEDVLALTKAVNSGDTDLIYHVLLHLHKRLPLGSFFRLIEDGGPALAPASRLLQVYAREQNREMLRDFYYSDDRRVDSAVLCLEEAGSMTDPNAKISAVKAAQKFFSEDKERTFEAKMMDENARLLTYQQQLEKETDGKIPFFGLSVNETIRTCLMNGLSKKAEKVRADFKVPDKRFWYTKLYALTAMRDFDGLDAFAKSKRSPIGYEVFVRHLVSKGHSKEATNFVARCDAPRRVDLYVECGEWRLAAKECKDRGDKNKLEQLKKTCPNSLIAREIEQIAGTMK